MKKEILFAIFLIILYTGCNDERNVEDGFLSGSTWKRDYSSKSSVSENDHTETINFSSEKSGISTKTGTWKVYSYSTKKWNSGIYNDKNEFTYIYSPELKQGVITYTNGKEVLFTISDNYKTLSTGGDPYTRK